MTRTRIFTDTMAALGLNGRIQSLIGGVLMDGQGEDIPLIDPYTEEELTRYADADAALATRACDAAARAQRVWMGDFTAAGRGQVMQDAARAITAHAEPLARLDALIAGKPIRDCRVEIAKVAEMFAYYAGWADKLHGEVIPVPSGHLTYTIREPLGVVFQITPWNAPAFTGGWQIAPAIAAGNGMTMVLGGEADAIEAIRPLLDALTARTVHIGGPGAGHAAKIVNNMLCAANLVLVAEAVRLGQAAGVAPAALLEGVNAGSGRSAVSEVNFPKWVLPDAFDSGFTMGLMRKDVRLAQTLAEGAGVPVPAFTRIAQIWADSAATLPDGDDFNRIVQFQTEQDQ